MSAGQLFRMILWKWILMGYAGGWIWAANPVLNPAAESVGERVEPGRIRFEVAMPEAVRGLGQDARLLVVLTPPGGEEPRLRLGRLGAEAPTVLGVDVAAGSRSARVSLGTGSALFPWRSLGELPTGQYQVQALLMTNRDLWIPSAPGNWFSDPVPVRIDAHRRDRIALSLTRFLPVEVMPEDREFVRFRRIRSEVLSRFWGREMWMRVGVVLPGSWEPEGSRRYPLVLDIGGFGSRYDRANGWLRKQGGVREAWLASDAPQLIWVTLDGAGPLGDPYQVDSENHGPYGTALMTEVLPVLEHEFRAIGQPWARFTTGGSTGGWVSFALQCLYPEMLGGCWSGFPDPLDFRHFQLLDLYADSGAFVNGEGFERPSARTLNGDVKFTMRHEVQYENVLGLGDVFTRSGGQWGAWNATFGSRGTNGWPVPAWDSRTGRMDPIALKGWERWDLRRMLERDWAVLGPKLRGKLRVWVGESDEYFLNHAVRRMDEMLARMELPAEARFEYGTGRGHGWNPRTQPEMWREMQAAADAGAPVESGREAYFRTRFMHGTACVHCKGGR